MVEESEEQSPEGVEPPLGTAPTPRAVRSAKAVAPKPRAGAPTSRRAARRRAELATVNLGEVFARAVRVLGHNFLSFVFFALVLNVPFIAYRLAQTQAVWGGEFGTEVFNQTTGLVVQLASFLAGLMLQCVVSYGTYAQLSGRRGSLRTSMLGLRRFFPVLGIAVLIIVMVYGAMIVISIIGLVGGPLGLVLFGIAGIAFGVSIFCAYFVAIQAAIVERGGIARSMARSAWLTRGSRWKVFVFVLLLYVVPWILAIFGYGWNFSESFTLGGQRSWILAAGVIGIFLSVAQAVVPAVLYYDLRRAKEGVDISEILEVFE